MLRETKMSDRKKHEQHDGGVVLQDRPEEKTKKPRMYKVMIHNDDYTTMEFVIWVLEKVFHHSSASATRIMLSVHSAGVGVAGIYTRDVSETRMEQVVKLAREQGHPLQCSMEPE